MKSWEQSLPSRGNNKCKDPCEERGCHVLVIETPQSTEVHRARESVWGNGVHMASPSNDRNVVYEQGEVTREVLSRGVA